MKEPDLDALAERIGEVSEHVRTVLFALIALCVYALLAVYQISHGAAELVELTARQKAAAAEYEAAAKTLAQAHGAADDAANAVTSRREGTALQNIAIGPEVLALVAQPEGTVNDLVEQAHRQIKDFQELGESIAATKDRLEKAKKAEGNAAARVGTAVNYFRNQSDPAKQGAALHEMEAAKRGLEEARKSATDTAQRLAGLEKRLPSAKQDAAAAEAFIPKLTYVQTVQRLGALRAAEAEKKAALARSEEAAAAAQRRKVAADAAVARNEAEAGKLKLPVVDVEVSSATFLVAAPILVLAIFLYLEVALGTFRQLLGRFPRDDRAAKLFSSFLLWGEESKWAGAAVFAACHLFVPASLLLLSLRATDPWSRLTCFVALGLSLVRPLLLWVGRGALPRA